MLRSPSVKSAFLALFLTVGAAPAVVSAAHAESYRTVRVGVMAGEEEDVWRVVARNAAQRHLRVELVPFSDYAVVNPALDEHDLDANAFQTSQYLDAQNRQRGFHIVSAGTTYVQPIGLYSKKWKKASDIPDGAGIAIPNDPSNEGRALLLLDSIGLIKLGANPGLYPTVLDIADNPHDFDFKELDGGMVARSLSDLDAAVVNTTWARKAGLDFDKERLAQERTENNPYVNLIAVNEADAKRPWTQELVRAFRQPNVRQALQEQFKGTALPVWRP